jgi:hypothetical protein
MATGTLLNRAAAAFALSWPLLGLAIVVVLVVLGQAQSDLLDYEEDFNAPTQVVLSEPNLPQTVTESQGYRDLRERLRTHTIVYAGLTLVLSLSVATFMFLFERRHAEFRGRSKYFPGAELRGQS